MVMAVTSADRDQDFQQGVIADRGDHLLANVLTAGDRKSGSWYKINYSLKGNPHRTCFIQQQVEETKKNIDKKLKLKKHNYAQSPSAESANKGNQLRSKDITRTTMDTTTET